MPEPSLGEILSFGVDPDLGGGVPSVLNDSRQMLATIQENSKLASQRAWQKYTYFQDNLQSLYQQIGDVSKLEVATEDREALDKDRKELLDKIWKSPKEFFGSGNAKQRAEIEGILAKYRSNATESKLNKVYDMAHRTFMEQTPELNTEDNKKVVDQYLKQPLGARKSYNLNMPTVFDYSKFTQDIFKTPGVSKTDFGYEYSPDKHFMQELTKTTLSKDAFMRNWNAGLLGTDKYGHSIRTWANQQYKQLTDEQKKNLKVESPEDLWKTIGEQTFGSKQDITTAEKGKLLPNYFERDMNRAAQQMKLLKTRYGLMAGMEALRQGNRKDLEDVKHQLKIKYSGAEYNAHVGALGQNTIYEAIDNGETVDVNGKQMFKMKVGDAALNAFGKGSGFLREQPDAMATSPDGEEVTTIYYKDGKVDADKTKTFTADEFIVEFGKSVFGTSGAKAIPIKERSKPASAKPKPNNTGAIPIPEGATIGKH